MIKLKSLLIVENYSLAKKLYIDTGILDDTAVKFLSRLCDNDYTFKTLADLYIENLETHHIKNNSVWTSIVKMLRDYNKNVFPVKDFSYDSKEPTMTIATILLRNKCIEILKKWPSIAKRNLNGDIKKHRHPSQFGLLKQQLEEINNMLSYLENRSDTAKSVIYKKIFSSDHPTFNDVSDFLDNKSNLLYGSAFTRNELYSMVKDHDDYLNIVYDKNNIVIVDVTGQPGIKLIGCNSLWCFTYGNEYGKAGEQWDEYSHNNHVYAIINFDMEAMDPEFIHIVTKPFYIKPYYDPNQLDFNFDDEQKSENPYDSGIYDMQNNEKYGDPYDILLYLVKNDHDAVKLITFKD